MAAKEVCKNPKCPFLKREDNPDHKPYERDYIKVSDRLCPWCESKLQS